MSYGSGLPPLRYALTVVSIAAVASLAAGQAPLSNVLGAGPEAVRDNPALFAPYAASVHIAGFDQGATTSRSPDEFGARVGDAFLLRASAVVSLDADPTELAATGSIPTLGFNRRVNRAQFGAYHAVRARGFATVPAGAIQLAVAGNATRLGTARDVLPEGRLVTYHEITGYFAHRVGRRWAWSVQTSLLGGNSALVLGGERARLTTDPDGFAIAYDLDAELRSAGFAIDVEHERYELDFAPARVDRGVGAALGASLVLRASRTWELGLAVAELGAIRWRGDGARRHTATGRGAFRGQTGNVFAEDYAFSLETVIDDLPESADLRTERAAFSTRLAPKLTGHARYRVREATDLTWVARGFVYPERVAGTLGLGVAQRFDDALHVNVYGVYAAGAIAPGGSATLNLAGVRLRVACDNLFALGRPERSRYAQLSAGLDLNFGRIRASGRRFGWFDAARAGGRTTPDNYL